MKKCKKSFYFTIKNKVLIFLFIMIIIKKYNFLFKIINLKLKENLLDAQKYINIPFNNQLNLIKRIKIGIYGYSIKNGGRARMTALLVNYLETIKLFNIYLFTKVDKEENEYKISKDIKRKTIKDNLILILKKSKINVLIYELDDINEIKTLNNLENIKIIFYHHSSTFDWIYKNYEIFKNIYKEFLNSKYFVSIIPFENDYLLKKWGIKSIFINDFITFNYNSVISSNLSSKRILMIGRGNSKKKRFPIGILSMEYITKEINECELYIISNLTGTYYLQQLVENLNLEDNIYFIGYSSIPEVYFKNTSLHIFPSISESFGLVLCETKIYGIPNVLIGLDYLSISNGGTIIVYDDSSEILAREILSILLNKSKKKELGREGRRSMKNFNNELFLIKWIKLIFSVYFGDKYYQILRKKEKNINKSTIFSILDNQIKLLRKRIFYLNNITLNDFINFTYMSNII